MEILIEPKAKAFKRADFIRVDILFTAANDAKVFRTFELAGDELPARLKQYLSDNCDQPWPPTTT